MKKLTKTIAWLVLFLSCLLLTGCDGNVGVGMSVGVPVGNHGYMSVGSHRWL